MSPEKKNLERCPHCGKELHPSPKYATRFHKWGTVASTVVLSLMLLAIDLVNDGDVQEWRMDWSNYAIFGLWIF